MKFIGKSDFMTLMLVGSGQFEFIVLVTLEAMIGELFEATVRVLPWHHCKSLCYKVR